MPAQTQGAVIYTCTNHCLPGLAYSILHTCMPALAAYQCATVQSLTAAEMSLLLDASAPYPILPSLFLPFSHLCPPPPINSSIFPSSEAYKQFLFSTLPLQLTSGQIQRNDQ